MDRRSTATALAVIGTTWAAIVLVQAGMASGDWVGTLRDGAWLAGIAAVCGVLAAAVDDLVEELLTGRTGGGSGGGPGGRASRRPIALKVRAGRGRVRRG